jgi:ligand-binding SRPBCC domain-containing protein
MARRRLKWHGVYFELTDHFEVAADPWRCWAFFATVDNLPLITPPWLNFRIVRGGGVAIAQGALLDYTIRWMGLPVKWRTKIVDWAPPRQFIDLQVRGPYALWMHQHTFGPTPGGGTECRDRVVYRLPLPAVGRLVHAAVVRRQLLEIFRFRRKVIAEHLGWVRAAQGDVEIKPLE